MRVKFLILLIPIVGLAVAGSQWKSHAEAVTAQARIHKAKRFPSSYENLPMAPEAALLLPPLHAGEPAPDFTLPDQNGHLHQLSKLRGKTVVLSFYPQDLTYTCSAEAISLTKSKPAIETRNAVVFGVSVQPVASKAQFAQRLGIKHPLLADSERSVARKYHVLNKDGLAARVTFIIGPSGTILSTDQNVNGKTHGADVLQMLDVIKTQPKSVQVQHGF